MLYLASSKRAIGDIMTKFKLTNTACTDLGYVELNTIEELLELKKKHSYPLILDNDGTQWSLEIYDGWRE